MSSTRSQLNQNIPILTRKEIHVISQKLGSGGFCTVSAVRRLDLKSSSSSISTACSSEEEKAIQKFTKQFDQYYEKHHSPSSIVIPGRTTSSSSAASSSSSSSNNKNDTSNPKNQKPPKICIKELKKSLDTQTYAIGLHDLANEIEILSSCSHPNIITLYAVGYNDSLVSSSTSTSTSSTSTSNIHDVIKEAKLNFVIIDQLKSTLRNKLYKWKDESITSSVIPFFFKTTKLKRIHKLWIERLLVILKIASVIQYLHEKGIIHRDIHPDNIGFSYDNDLKLFDFGLGKFIHKHEHEHEHIQNINDEEGGEQKQHQNQHQHQNQQRNSNTTSTGRDENEIFDLTSNTGTLRYMAPEVALGIPYGYKVDVYSLSLVMHEILSLMKPFVQIKSPDVFITHVMKGGMRPIIDESWPSSLKHMIGSMWSSDYGSRPTSKQVVDQLEILLRGDDEHLYPK